MVDFSLHACPFFIWMSWPTPLTNVDIFFHLFITLSKLSLKFAMSNEFMCSSLFASTKATTSWFSRLGYLDFWIDLTSFTIWFEPCIFLFPFFLLSSNCAWDCIEMGLPTSMILRQFWFNASIFFGFIINNFLLFCCLHAHCTSTKGM